MNRQWNLQRASQLRWFFSLLVFAAFVFLVAQASGQAPAFKLDEALLKKATISAMDQARKEGISKADLTREWDKFPAFEDYYTKYVFGKMKDGAYLNEIGTLTQSLLDDLDRAGKSKTPAAPLVRGYIIDIGKHISTNNTYHPAARINATLLLALVDDASEDPRTRKPPVPSADALRTLVQLYMKPEYPDGVRAAALQGIARHVSLNAVKNAQYRSGIAKMMIELAKSEPPMGRSPAAHAFMQRYAVDILNVLANPNTSVDTAQTLVALSTDAKKPTLISAYAASKIAVMQPGKQKLNQLPTVLQAWAGRAADTLDGEIKRIANLDPPMPVRDQPAMPIDESHMVAGGVPGGYEGGPGNTGAPDMSMYQNMGPPQGFMPPGGMMGPPGIPSIMAPANPQPREVIASRRRINLVLQQLQLGVTGQVTPGSPTKPAGLLATGTPADQAAFDEWIKTVSEVVAAINVETLDTRIKFVEEMKKQAAILRSLSGVAIVPAAGAIAKPAVPGTNELDPHGGPPAIAAPAVAGPVMAAPAAAPVKPGAVALPAMTAPAVVAPPVVAPPAAAAEVVNELE